jgi:hypothetical protein
MSTAAPKPPESAPPVEAPTKAPVWRRSAKLSDDVLGIGWLYGSLCAAVFRRNKMVDSWAGSAPVQTMAEFEPALDEALTKLDFTGTEVFLLLENEQFVHQPESAPAFSDSVARAYLHGRVQRYEKDHEPVLWVGQQTLSAKQEQAFILHLLPRSLYSELNNLLLARRLDLTRILPLVVPIKRELDRFPIAKDKPVLVAVEAGGATVIMVAKVSGQLVLARTILASWSADPARIGVEINRSRLYAKQQYGTTVEKIWLLGQNNQSTAEVNAKCGADKQIMVLPTKPVEWLQTAAKLPPRQPINLVAGYLKRKRRNSIVRRLLIAACWLGLGLFLTDTWTRAQDWKGEKRRLAALSANEQGMTAERDRLAARNRAVEREKNFIRQADDERLPPVAGKFLAYLVSVLPGEIRLTDLAVKWEGAAGGWSFRLDGAIEADEETAREAVGTLQRQLTQSPLRARFNATARAVVAMPITAGPAATEVQRFSLEGVMLEN